MNEPEKKPTETQAQTAPVAASPVADATPIAAQPAQVAGESGQSAQKPEDQPVGTIGRRIPLKYSFTSRGKPLTEIRYTRRPTASDLVSHSSDNMAQNELHTIASMLGLIPEDLMRMDGADYLALQREYVAFLS